MTGPNILPSKGGEKAYFLLKDALATTNKSALGRFIMRKENIMSFYSYKNVLLMHTLHYPYGIRKIKISTEERKLAIMPINKLSLKF